MSEEKEEEKLEEKLEKLAEDNAETKGKKYLLSIMEDIERNLRDNGMGDVNYDTGIIIDGELDTIIIKKGKVVFGNDMEHTHDLDWALEKVSPFQLVNSLRLAQIIVDNYIKLQKAPPQRKQELADFGSIFG